MEKKQQDLKAFLDRKVREYNQPAFIADDPICIPHLFSQSQDIEIAGLFAAVFAWGNRKTIIAKSAELMRRMDNAPYDFVRFGGPSDLRRLQGFRHRTFSEDDLFYFVAFLQHHYARHSSLQTAFSQWMLPHDETIANALNGFRAYFFSLDHLPRTRKHISAPALRSSCKRLCMYLRWMVRRDTAGVDFGLWKNILPRQLVCPVDLHVARVARRFGILATQQPDWNDAVTLTQWLRTFDKNDPVKYDFALFALGVMEKYA